MNEITSRLIFQYLDSIFTQNGTRHVLVLTLDVLRVININFLLKISTPETHKELKRVTLICLLCPMLVFSFKSTIFGTRSKDSSSIKLRKRPDVILLHGRRGGLYTDYGKACFFYLFFPFLSPPLAQC